MREFERAGEYCDLDKLQQIKAEYDRHRQCGSCFYWYEEDAPTYGRYGEVVYNGDCRRRAPGIYPGLTENAPLKGMWPETEYGDCCGEYEKEHGPTFIDKLIAEDLQDLLP